MECFAKKLINMSLVPSWEHNHTHHDHEQLICGYMHMLYYMGTV